MTQYSLDNQPATIAPASFLKKLRHLCLRFLVPNVLVSAYYFAKSGSKISTRAEVEISPNLKFGRGCTVSSFTKIKATDGAVTIGDETGFATGCYVSPGTRGIHIGDDVLVGPNVVILGGNYIVERRDIPFKDQGWSSKGVKIGSNVWIGAGTTILDGSVIGDNTIVVANSLVNRRYPPNVVLQGNPAKVILKRDPGPQQE